MRHREFVKDMDKFFGKPKKILTAENEEAKKVKALYTHVSRLDSLVEPLKPRETPVLEVNEDNMRTSALEFI
jgi:hypothetical protein